MAGKDLQLLLLGAGGCGKSSLGNAILGEAAFELSSGLDSESGGCTAARRQVRGRSLLVADTPGLEPHDPQATEQLMQSAAGRCPGGAHALLLTVRCDVRFSQDDWDAIDCASKVFGPDFYKFCIVVFTHADKFGNNEQQFNDWLQKMRQKMPKLHQLLQDCGNRFAMICNSSSCDTQQRELQVSKLLQAVDHLHRGAGRMFTNETFDMFGQRLAEGNADVQEIAAKVVVLEVQVEKMKEEMQKMKKEMEAMRQQGPAGSEQKRNETQVATGETEVDTKKETKEEIKEEVKEEKETEKTNEEAEEETKEEVKETKKEPKQQKQQKQQKQPALPQLNLALVGKTGCGKSSLGNAMLDMTAFEAKACCSSVTFDCSLAAKEVNGRLLKIVDTHGTMDTHNKEAAMKELFKAIRYCAEGFDAFLLVVRWGRFTEEEQKAIDDVRQVFGDDFYQFSIVVFTHTDNFGSEKEFRQGLTEDRGRNRVLDKLLHSCANRFMMIDNGRRCDKELQQQQLKKLIGMIDGVHEINGRRYTDKMFETAKKQREEKEKQEREKQERHNREMAEKANSGWCRLQ